MGLKVRLSVYLGDRLAGYLSSTAEKGVVFSYDDAYINAGKIPLSLSLPLGKTEFSQKKCLPFFEGLLPEGDVKKGFLNTCTYQKQVHSNC